MKTLNKILIISIVTVLTVPVAGFAQDKSREVNSRSIGRAYEKKEADGMKIWFRKVEGAKFIPIDPSMSFKTGDKLIVEFESNFDGYIYFINVDPLGKSKVIYPVTAKGEINKVEAGQHYTYPSADVGPFEFQGDVKGYEIIQVIMSREQIPLLDEAIKNSEGELGATAASAAAELVGAASKNSTEKRSGIVADNLAKVLPDTGRSKNITRSVEILAPPRDKQKEADKKTSGKDDGTTVIVGYPDSVPQASGKPEQKYNSGKLEGNQRAVFEIRFNHI